MTDALRVTDVTKANFARADDTGERRLEDYNVTKRDLARILGDVTERTVDNLRHRGLLPAPLKMGIGRSARVRWTAADVETLRRNLAALAAGQQKAA